MRIGFFTDTYTPQINGVVTSIELFRHALEQRGHEVWVFAPTPEEPDDDPLVTRFHSLPFVFQPELRLASPVSIEAARVIRDANLDIIHSHDPFSIGLYGLSASRLVDVPYIHTYHTLYPEYVHYVWDTRLTQKLAERLSRDFCQRCSSIIAPSTKIERYLREWGVTTPIEILATGIDVARFSTPNASAHARLRRRIGLREDEKAVLFMGRLGAEKSVDLLVRSIWHLRQNRVRLVIAGDGPERETLERLAASLGIEDQVTFLGYLEGDEQVAAYHVVDAFVFASTSETQGLVIGEAMAAGLPVIAVRDKAVQDFVISERTGLIVQARPEDMAAAIDRLLGDAEMHARYSAAGRSRSACFSIEHQTERLELHYEHALDAHPRRRALHRLPLPRMPKSLTGGYGASPDDR